MMRILGLFLTVLSARAAQVQYYADSACTSAGGGPPGLEANPWSCDVGSCCELLSSGYAVQVLSCDGKTAKTLTYPTGCSNAAGLGYTTTVGECAENSGIYTITKC